MGHESRLLLIHQQGDREGLEEIADPQAVPGVNNLTGNGVSPRAGKPVRHKDPGIQPDSGTEKILLLSH